MRRIKKEQYPSIPKESKEYFVNIVKKAKRYKWKVLVLHLVSSNSTEYKKLCSGIITNIYPQNFIVTNPNESVAVQFSSLVTHEAKIEVI